MLFRPKNIRTGIDLGTTSVKLVRGTGKPRLERVTHWGIEDWSPGESDQDVERQAGALRKLLKRLGLNRSLLGRIVVAVDGREANIREVTLPRLDENELRRALPYEAKKHLYLNEMSAPVVASQVLDFLPGTEEIETDQMHVLIAAVPESIRNIPLRVLAQNGLEPEVVDLEPLAGLNELLAQYPDAVAGNVATGLLDLGGCQAKIHITDGGGGLLTRFIGPGVPRVADSEVVEGYIADLVAKAMETTVYYRGKFRRDVESLYVSGGGAMLPDIADILQAGLKKPIQILDPLSYLADGAIGKEDVSECGPRFVTACGLCRWWDEADV